jgi:hypothetical protein
MYGVVVVALLLLIAIQLFLSVRQETQLFDESSHLFAGCERRYAPPPPPLCIDLLLPNVVGKRSLDGNARRN